MLTHLDRKYYKAVFSEFSVFWLTILTIHPVCIALSLLFCIYDFFLMLEDHSLLEFFWCLLLRYNFI